MLHQLKEWFDSWAMEIKIVIVVIGVVTAIGFIGNQLIDVELIELKGPMTNHEVEEIARRVYAEERLKEFQGE